MITLATIRYGAKVGGLLAGFPATVAFSLAFIGWTQSVDAAVEATTALPLAVSSTASFPLLYSYLVKRARFTVSLVAAVSFWVVSSFVFSEVSLRFGLGFWDAVAGYCLITGFVYVFLAEKGHATVPVRGVRPTAPQWAGRFILSGGIIVMAVLLSETIGPAVGGVFSSFPAIIISTIYIVSRVEGIEASRSTAVPVLVGTVFAIIPYVITVRYAFPALGLLYGTLLGYAVASGLSVVGFYLISREGT